MTVYIATETITTTACPFQSEGKLSNGLHFYFRYRYGRAALYIGVSVEDAINSITRAAWLDHGDEWAGALTTREYREIMNKLLTAVFPN